MLVKKTIESNVHGKDYLQHKKQLVVNQNPASNVRPTPSKLTDLKSRVLTQRRKKMLPRKES